MSGVAPTGLVKFGTITKEAAAEAKKKVKSGAGNFYQWKDGINTIRVLPPPPGESAAWVIVYQHFFRNWSGGQKSFSFNCPKRMGQGRCPGCEQEEALLKTGNPVDKDKAKEFRAKPRVFALIVDRKDEEAGVQIAAFGSMVLEQMVELIEDDDVYGADFTHPFEGDDLVVKRWEEKGFIKYRVNIRNGDHDRLAETEEQMVKWIESAPSLTPHVQVQTYEQLMQRAAELTAEARGEPAPVRQPAIATTAKHKPAAMPEPAPDPEPAAAGPFADATGGMTAAAASDAGLTDDAPF